MPSNTLTLPPVPMNVDDPKVLVTYVKALVLQLTTILSQIQTQFDQVQGLKGNTATLGSQLAMAGKKISGIAAGSQPTDVTNIQDLQENALYLKAGKHTAAAPIEAPFSVHVPKARHGDEVIPLNQLVNTFAGVDAVTNNVTAGGVNATIADFSDLTTYANDAAAIRNDIYQLARSVKQISDALRTFRIF